MDIRLTDAAYTERLASFLTSLGQNAIVSGPDAIELPEHDAATKDARVELEIYLRVWAVLYPDATVALSQD